MLSNRTGSIPSAEALVVDTGSKRDGRGHRIATNQEKEALVAEYRRSGHKLRFA